LCTIADETLQIVVSLVLLYLQVGPAMFAGLGFMLLLIPVNALLIKVVSCLCIEQTAK
jgi:hypothetical protein